MDLLVTNSYLNRALSDFGNFPCPCSSTWSVCLCLAFLRIFPQPVDETATASLSGNLGGRYLQSGRSIFVSETTVGWEFLDGWLAGHAGWIWFLSGPFHRLGGQFCTFMCTASALHSKTTGGNCVPGFSLVFLKVVMKTCIDR